MNQKIPRLMIGATGSGCGKTTLTCGLLKAFSNRGKKAVSFKCGPDYIDPMFHAEVLGLESRNLDLFFMAENTAKCLLCENTGDADIAVIEGVMGYYDGLAGTSTEASSYDLAVRTRTPSILLVDGRGKSVSLLAEIKGFLEFREDSNIKGVILNRISPMIYPQLKEAIEDFLPIKVYGYMPVMEGCSLESRHLGLVTAKEVGNLKQIVSRLAVQAEKSIELDALMELATGTDSVSCQELDLPSRSTEGVRIGVAMDKAFCFYYQDNLDLLSKLGAEVIPFSPLKDDHLPKDLNGLIFGGGYPELYLPQLADNSSIKAEIKSAIENGIPCLAECGGFMYLQAEVKDEQGYAYPMVGVIEGKCFPTKKLGRFGYITLTALENNLLSQAGETIKGHEFHYWDSTNTGGTFQAQKPLRNKNWDCMLKKNNLLAGYPHIHFYSNPQAAENFILASSAYQRKEKK